MADMRGSSGALIARNVALVLGVIALVVWFAMMFVETVTVDGIDCLKDGSDPVAVPSYELSACADAIDAHHHALGFAISVALVLFIIAGTIHWTAKRSAAS
jgi:hypothetical protein